MIILECWIHFFLGLASATNISLSLVNEAQYLLINVASILQLKEHISAR